MKLSKEFQFFTYLLESYAQHKNTTAGAVLKTLDEKAIYEKGLEVGIEKGMKEGIQRGIEKGIEKGIMEGSQKEKIEITKKMLELKIDKETIAEATGLTEQEIEKILD